MINVKKRNYFVTCYLILIGVLFFTNISFAQPVSAIDNILYENKEQQYITKGVEFDKTRLLTEMGWLDYYAMVIDLNEPTIDLRILESQDEYGKKKRVSELTGENNAVGGLNGDFFITHRDPTDPLGTIIKNGQIITAYDDNHKIEGGQNTLLVNEDGKVNFEMLEFQFGLSNVTNGEWIEIASFNKLTSVFTPTYFDTRAMKNTETIDKLNTQLFKVVIQNDMITYVSKIGEKVNVPEDGYIITFASGYSDEIFKKFKVGDKVRLNRQDNIDITNVKMGFTGGGKILDNGQIPSDYGLAVQPTKRHPRSAIGISKDGSKVILLAVDGRGSSIGANISDLALLLKQYGAYNAIHLDGGGSTAIAGRELGHNSIDVFNDPSDGAERRVVNGIGVVSNAPKGELEGILISSNNNRIFVNSGVSFDILAYDEFFNPMSIDKNEIVWETKGIEGTWKNNIFYPNTLGNGEIIAHYEDKQAKIDIYSMDTPQILDINPKIIEVGVDGQVKVNIVGLDKDGYSSVVNSNSVQWEINSNLGKIENGVFKAGHKPGQGKLIGRIGDTVVEGYIKVGNKQTIIDNFEDDSNLNSSSYPKDVFAELKLNNREMYQEKASAELHYIFEGDAKHTQAAYVNFTKPIQLDGKPNGLGLWVFGDESGNWLRARIKDKEGNTKAIDLSYNIDWNGWKYLEANIPQDVQYPIEVERLYVTSLSNKEKTESKILFDGLSALYPLEENDNSIPESKFRDYLNTPVSNEQNGFKVNIFGSTAGKNRLIDHVIQRKVMEKMNENAELAIFGGYTDVNKADMNIPYIEWKDEYNVTDYNNLRIINLATSKNGMRTTNPNQWKSFQSDLDSTKQQHIIIVMNQNPLSKSGFYDEREGELFHQILKEYREKTGKNIFVINASGYKTDVNVIEGIRYFDLNGLWYKIDKDNLIDINNTFYTLQFNIDNEKINYELKPVYPKIVIE